MGMSEGGDGIIGISRHNIELGWDDRGRKEATNTGSTSEDQLKCLVIDPEELQGWQPHGEKWRHEGKKSPSPGSEHHCGLDTVLPTTGSPYRL